MANRHFGNYKPEDAGARKRRRERGTGSFKKVGIMVAAGVLLYLARVPLQWVLQSNEPTPPVLVSSTRPNGSALMPILIERAQSTSASVDRPSRYSPLLVSFNQHLRSREGLRRFGVRQGHPSYIYSAAVRPGSEAAFSMLAIRGIGAVRLHEVAVPASWTPWELDVHKSHWESQCNVDRELISQWSSFTVQHGRLVDQCHVGRDRLCLILSPDCGSAFDDLPLQMESQR